MSGHFESSSDNEQEHDSDISSDPLSHTAYLAMRTVSYTHVIEVVFALQLFYIVGVDLRSRSGVGR